MGILWAHTGTIGCIVLKVVKQSDVLSTLDCFLGYGEVQLRRFTSSLLLECILVPLTSRNLEVNLGNHTFNPIHM